MTRALMAAAALIAAMLSVPAFPHAASADSGCPSPSGSYVGGAGTEASPWQISTPAQLQALRDDSISGWDDSFVVTANIDMGGCVWTKTIGDSTRSFTGLLDGGGHTVSGLAISVSGDDSPLIAGFVGSLGAGGTLSRLGFTGPVTANSGNANASVYAGGLVGEALGGSTIRYSYATGNVLATLVDGGNPEAHVGGLVGRLGEVSGGGNVSDSYATGSAQALAGASGRSSVGGLVGTSVVGFLGSSYSSGPPTAVGGSTRQVGGLFGNRVIAFVGGTYWDTTSSGVSSANGAGSFGTGTTGKTTAALQTISAYSGWSIRSTWAPFDLASSPQRIWGICEGVSRAYLLWQYTSNPCPSAPGAPTITGVTPGGTSASIAFTVDDTGNTPLTRLEFAVDDTVTVDDSTTNVASPYALSNLASGTSYSVYMRAVNAQGTGPWSSPTAFTTQTPPPPPPPAPAGAPRDVVATAGDGSLVAAWQPPVSEGSYPVTQYKATASPGGRVCLTSATTCAIDGLTNGVSYTVTVQALTGAGWSPSSAASNTIVPRPSSVPSLTITGSRGSGAERNMIRVRGTSTDLAGERVTLWISVSGRKATPAPTTASIKADGTFTWSRKLNRAAVIYAEVGTTRSNTIRILAAR